MNTSIGAAGPRLAQPHRLREATRPATPDALYYVERNALYDRAGGEARLVARVALRERGTAGAARGGVEGEANLALLAAAWRLRAALDALLQAPASAAARREARAALALASGRPLPPEVAR